MTLAPLTEIVRKRLHRLSRQKRFSQTEVAERLGITPGAVSRNLTTEDRPLTIEFVEVCAVAASEPIAELVAPVGSLVRQLTPEEAALLRYARAWPRTVLHALLVFLRYFSRETPEEREFRRLQEFWRHLGESDRLRLVNVATTLQERALTPDQRRLLADRLIGAAPLDEEGRVVESPITGRPEDGEDDEP